MVQSTLWSKGFPSMSSFAFHLVSTLSLDLGAQRTGLSQGVLPNKHWFWGTKKKNLETNCMG